MISLKLCLYFNRTVILTHKKVLQIYYYCDYYYLY